MKKKLTQFTVLLLLTTSSVLGQDFWAQKSNFGGSPRGGAASFVIGDTAYTGTGYVQFTGETNDWWAYNPSSDTWTQKADFPGAPREHATAFRIGNKGYLGAGDGLGFFNDFWEYNAAINTWVRKADFPGVKRYGATGFSIGNKGYVGTGQISTGFTTLADFWEYDPLTNAWTQKANFAGGARQLATGFSIGSKGYIGLGAADVGTAVYQDFWEYLPASDSWVKKANFPGTGRYLATGFNIGNNGYIGGGFNSTVLYLRDFWEYHQPTDKWIQKADFGGTARYIATGFSIGSKGYLGTGLDVNGAYKNDLWEYNPAASVSANQFPVVSFDPISVTTWVGDSMHGYADGIGRAARFHTPIGIVADKAGNVYVGDNRNERIRKITKEGVVTTFAGNGIAGYTDGAGTAASLNFVVGMAIDSTGNIFFGERGNNALRKITPAGIVTTVIGSSGWGGRIPNFNGLAVDINGNIYVSDGDRNTILKVSAGGTVSVFAGNGNFAQVDGPGSTASFLNPGALVLDHAGNLIVADQNGELRKISKDGIVSTIHVPGLAAGLSATKVGLAVDAGDNIIVTADNIEDYLNFYVYKITPSLNMALLAGSGRGHVDSIGSDARFYVAGTLALDGQGSLFMNEYSLDYGVEFGHWLRKLSKPDLQFMTNAGVASGARYFTVSANNAFDAVSIQGSAAYEIATSEAGPWFPAAMSIGTTAGELNVMKIYIRLKAGLPAGIYNDSLELTAIGAATQKLGIKGFVREIDNTPPTVTCVPAQTFCFNNTNQYTAPKLIATDASYIREIHYTVSGATSRSGDGDNASGIFKPGRSVITWTATDWWSNSSTCETPVRVDQPLSVTVPDVYPLLFWGEANTLYIGFGPGNLILTASASGGTALPGNKYSYVWSNGATGKSITISPSAAGNYQYRITVTDSLGCQLTATKTIKVIDIRCGQRKNKVLVCWPNRHGNMESCVNENQVLMALFFGAKLGSCGNNTRAMESSQETGRGISIFPNPNKGSFVLQLKNLNNAELRILDQSGRIISTQLINGVNSVQNLVINLGRVANGLYLVQAISNEGVYTTKMMVQQ